MTQPDKQASFDGIAIINAALSPSMQQCIGSMTNPDLRQRRGVDFACIDNALAAAEQLVATHGPDKPMPAGGVWIGTKAAELLTQVRAVAEQAEPFRPKERRA